MARPFIMLAGIQHDILSISRDAMTHLHQTYPDISGLPVYYCADGEDPQFFPNAAKGVDIEWG